MNKNSLLILANCLVMIFFLSSARSQDMDKKLESSIHHDLLIVFSQIPNDFEKIDNITLRLLHAKVNPHNATECFQSLPKFFASSDFQGFDYYKKIHATVNVIKWFEDIFEPIKTDVYFDVCSSLKENSDFHNDIYFIVNLSLPKISLSEREKYVLKIINLLPLYRPNNALVISSLYTNLGRERCFEIIEEMKNKYSDNPEFIQEIEEAQNQILYNETHKDKGEKILGIP